MGFVRTTVVGRAAEQGSACDGTIGLAMFAKRLPARNIARTSPVTGMAGCAVTVGLAPRRKQ